MKDKIAAFLVMIVWCLGIVEIADTAGCALFSNTSGNAVYVQAAVDVAVATAVQKGIPASQIKKIAQLALAADSGTTATVAAIEQTVSLAISKLNLPPGDLAAANILTAALGAIIQTQLANNTQTATAQVAIATVLNDVIIATSAYGA